MTRTIGKRIAAARGKYHLSQAELGASIGVTRAAISQYEQAKIRPRTEVLVELAKVFNAAEEWFEWGRGAGPDSLGAPYTIHEISLAKITPKTTKLREHRTGRDWRLPTSAVPGIDLDPEHMVAVEAPNAADPILCGDRVLVDARRRVGDGVFLCVDEGLGAHFRVFISHKSADADLPILGRAVAFFRTL
jgi:transcriptional regulator with XRE-family HTH domain